MSTVAPPQPPEPAGPLPDTSLENRSDTLRADLVMEGGGVKGIGLVGAVTHLADQGYVFPRVGGTSAGAIVAALVAAYQTRGVPLAQIKTDMEELDYSRFKDAGWLENHTGVIGKAFELLTHDGVYSTAYLEEWLHSKLDPIGVKTFADLRITDADDPGSGLPPERRYRLVVHTSDLTRQALVRLPWDLPQYLIKDPASATLEQRLAVIDSYGVVDAVRASMSIPFFFRPEVITTNDGHCTWVDGGLLSNFPVTCFERTDGRADRWPTFGIKLAGKPKINIPEYAVKTPLSELMAIVHTTLGEWNRYTLADQDVDSRTVWVDTLNVSAVDFDLDQQTQNTLYANGQSAAVSFLEQWSAAHPAK